MAAVPFTSRPAGREERLDADAASVLAAEAGFFRSLPVESIVSLLMMIRRISADPAAVGSADAAV
jgi:hypothetical protein